MVLDVDKQNRSGHTMGTMLMFCFITIITLSKMIGNIR